MIRKPILIAIELLLFAYSNPFIKKKGSGTSAAGSYTKQGQQQKNSKDNIPWTLIQKRIIM